MLRAIKCIWIEVADIEAYKGQRTQIEIDKFLRRAGFRAVRRDPHGAESDVLYANLRSPRGLLRWLTCASQAAWVRARFSVGRWRRQISKFR
jgi:hypothetical protein